MCVSFCSGLPQSHNACNALLDPWRVWELSKTKGESQVSMLRLWLVSRSTEFPKRPCLPFEPELALKEEGSKNHEQSWNPITPFLTHVTLLCLPTIYAENDDLEGKEKIRQPTVLFLFSPSLLFSRTMLVECVHVEKWKKSQINVQSFHWSAKNKVRMHVWAVKYELYHFSDSAYKFSTPIFAFKSGIVHYKWWNLCQ